MLISFSVEVAYAPHANPLEDTLLYVMLVPTTFGDIRTRNEQIGEEFSLILELPGQPGRDDNSKAYVTQVVPADHELPAGYLVATLSEWGKRHSSICRAQHLPNGLALWRMR
jgi:hypothetical protein